jgi:hypothetical protein
VRDLFRTKLGFQCFLSAAESGARSGDAADGFFDRIASAGGGELNFAFAAVQGGTEAGDAGDGLFDSAAGVHRAVDAVAGAAVEGRTGADLAVDGFINDRTLVIVMLTHMLLLIDYFSG